MTSDIVTSGSDRTLIVTSPQGNKEILPVEDIAQIFCTIDSVYTVQLFTQEKKEFTLTFDKAFVLVQWYIDALEASRVEEFTFSPVVKFGRNYVLCADGPCIWVTSRQNLAFFGFERLGQDNFNAFLSVKKGTPLLRRMDLPDATRLLEQIGAIPGEVGLLNRLPGSHTSNRVLAIIRSESQIIKDTPMHIIVFNVEQIAAIRQVSDTKLHIQGNNMYIEAPMTTEIFNMIYNWLRKWRSPPNSPPSSSSSSSSNPPPSSSSSNQQNIAKMDIITNETDRTVTVTIPEEEGKKGTINILPVESIAQIYGTLDNVQIFTQYDTKIEFKSDDNKTLDLIRWYINMLEAPSISEELTFSPVVKFGRNYVLYAEGTFIWVIPRSNLAFMGFSLTSQNKHNVVLSVKKGVKMIHGVDLPDAIRLTEKVGATPRDASIFSLRKNVQNRFYTSNRVFAAIHNEPLTIQGVSVHIVVLNVNQICAIRLVNTNFTFQGFGVDLTNTFTGADAKAKANEAFNIAQEWLHKLRS